MSGGQAKKPGRVSPNGQWVGVESGRNCGQCKGHWTVISTLTFPVTTPSPCFYQSQMLGAQALGETQRVWGMGICSCPNPPLWLSLSTLSPALSQAEPRDSGGTCRGLRLTTHSQQERQEQKPVGGSKVPHDPGDAAGHSSLILQSKARWDVV